MNQQKLRCASSVLGVLAVDALIGLAAPSLPAAAQAAGANNPGVQLQEQIRESAPPPRSYEAPADVDTNPGLEIETSIQDEETFFFKAVRVEGNKKIRTGLLVKPFLQYIGKDVSWAELKSAASQSERNYKDQGYITSRVVIPKQNIASGNVIVRVVEGFIDELEVRGASNGLQAYARKMLQPIASKDSKKIFNFKELERQLLLIRNFGGVKFNTTLLKGSSLGGSKLLLDLSADSLSGGVGFNNNLSEQLGDFQASLNFQYITMA